VALVLGPIDLVIGGLVVATADGGVGTGNRVAGAIVAMMLGLIGTALGGLRDLGWIHQSNMVLVGVLTVLFAVGVRQVLRMGRSAPFLVWCRAGSRPPGPLSTTRR
jgi:Family of unknown function (DUF6223)